MYNKCLFCNIVFAANARRLVCEKCEIVLTWKSSMDYLGAVNRVTELLRKGELDSKLRNENYCKENFGDRATQVIMDSIDNVKI